MMMSRKNQFFFSSHRPHTHTPTHGYRHTTATLYGLETVRRKEDTVNWVGAGAAAGAVTSLITGEFVGEGLNAFGPAVCKSGV